MSRKLVSIQRIEELRPIAGADKIEVAKILGWEVVVKKGEFRVGDTCAYFEIDSFLPERPEFEFLRKSCVKTFDGRTGFRLRTAKLRRQISQGLALPLDVLGISGGSVDTDLTSRLGVVKYDTEAPLVETRPQKWWQKWVYRIRKALGLTHRFSGNFPDFIPKTDETRVQNMGPQIEKWEGISGVSYFITEKLDGSSFTAYRKGRQYGVCSRNLSIRRDPRNRWWIGAYRSKIMDVLKAYGRDIAIQGELLGPQIQGNKYRLQNYDVYVFNIWDIKERRYWLPEAVLDFCKEHGLHHVPVVAIRPVNMTVSEILRLAEDRSRLYPEQEREGVVYVVTKDGARLGSFKAISNRFLLKNED